MRAVLVIGMPKKISSSDLIENAKQNDCFYDCDDEEEYFEGKADGWNSCIDAIRERAIMIIEPRKQSDRGGYLMMPLKRNVQNPKDKTWKLTSCPQCGIECWDRPLPEGYTADMFNEKMCTMCALEMATR